MRFYTSEELGPSQALTPEGFLVVHNAPLARTGYQLYSEKELPKLTGDSDGHIIVERPEDEVFRPDSIASFHGKPVTLDHPEEDVTPENWRDLAVGYVLNPRRGEGVLSHLLLGDLVVTCPKAIKTIRDGILRELSAGYDAEYNQETPGRAAQTRIRANHVALVQDGRCGTVCRIGDSAAELKRIYNDDGSIAFRTLDHMPSLMTRSRRRNVHLHLHL